MKYTKLSYNPSLTGFCQMDTMVYSTATGKELQLDLYHPWNTEAGVKYPAIVFVQGSAWTTPGRNYEIPQLSALSRRGYVVASISHRDTSKGDPFPAFLVDTKTAIRFLRTNADKFGIIPDRIAIWGTSSGGNTSLLTGLTIDDPAFRTKEYGDVSDTVKSVVACFPPTDLYKLFEALKDSMPQEQADMTMLAYFGTKDRDKARIEMDKYSPSLLIDQAKDYPPMLVLHGNADPLVPFAQGREFAELMDAAGKEIEFVEVDKAVHEGTFWSQELLDLVWDYLDRTV